MVATLSQNWTRTP